MNMDLFLIRHAAAVARSGDLEDALRPLTAEGKQKFAPVVEGMSRLGFRFDRLYHSPLLRAVETAELIMPLVKGESVATSLLAEEPGAGLLRELSGNRVALVGHQPWLGDLAAWLLYNDRHLGMAFDIKKGGVVWLNGDVAPGRMVLRAFLAPRILRAFSEVHSDDDNPA